MSEIRMKFRDDWIVVVDPNPYADSVTMCVDCGQFFGGRGTSLKEAMAAADAKMAKHKCQPVWEQRTGEDVI